MLSSNIQCVGFQCSLNGLIELFRSMLNFGEPPYSCSSFTMPSRLLP